MGDMVKRDKGQRTEDALLSAARTVFAEQGYFNAKVADIFEGAYGVDLEQMPSSPGRAQLLDALLEEFSIEVTESAMRSASDDPYESIRGAVAAYWTTFRDHLPQVIGLIQLSMTDAAYAERWRGVRATGVRGVIYRLEQARAEGRLAGVDIPTMASAIVSMLESFSWTWLAGRGDDGVPRPDDDTAIDTMTALWYGAVYGPVPNTATHR